MITTIILISLIVITGYLSFYSTFYEFEFLIFLIFIFSWIFFILHIIMLSLNDYNYKLFISKRKAIQETINVSRKTNNQFENTAIIKEIISFNIELEEYKMNNKTLILGHYIDNRFENIKSIK